MRSEIVILLVAIAMATILALIIEFQKHIFKKSTRRYARRCARKICIAGGILISLFITYKVYFYITPILEDELLIEEGKANNNLTSKKDIFSYPANKTTESAIEEENVSNYQIAESHQDIPPNEPAQNTEFKDVPDATTKLEDEIHAFLSGWTEAWQKTAGKNGDVEGYISYYSNDFRWEGLDIDGWKKYKTTINRKKKWLEIALSDITISQPTEDNRVEINFMQDYKSSNYFSKSSKSLILKREIDGWKIIGVRK